MGNASVLVQEWLEKNGKTHEWLAEQLGVQRPVLWRWLAGKRTPRIEFCAAIERITGVPSNAWAADPAKVA